MKRFIQKHEAKVIGALNGFDRIRFRGTRRLLACAGGMMSYLGQIGVLLKDFKDYVLGVTGRIREATVAMAMAAGQEVRYLPSSSVQKEEVARELLRRQGDRDGLICVLSSVERCVTSEVYRNRAKKELEVRMRSVKCLHYYHYMMHPVLGFMHVRFQTWFPLTVQVCVNGREWLARQMDEEGIGYVRRRNCFVDVENVGRVQELFDRQLRTNWPRLLNGLLPRVNPVDSEIFAGCPVPYYWSADETEWASDVLFRSPQELSELYPGLIRHGMTCLGSRDVLRFLGRKVPAQGGVHGNFTGEVTTDLRERPEGIRIKHRVNRNSIKMYNKEGSVLRVETTINDARDIKTYRPKEGEPGGPKQWRRMRKGVADLHRRAQVSQAANARYLDGLAGVESGESLAQVLEPLCRPVKWRGRRVRALNPLAHDDAALLKAVAHGTFTLNGFRNRDVRSLLYPGSAASDQVRRQASAVSRKFRLLRAHGLIRKVSGTHRYVLTAKGRKTISLLLLVREADATKLHEAA